MPAGICETWNIVPPLAWTSTEPLFTVVAALFGPVIDHWTADTDEPPGRVSSRPTVPVGPAGGASDGA
jgi:hypothetical protein